MMFKTNKQYFTRSGDAGFTILPNGCRVSKASNIVEFIGELDYLMAVMGICVALITKEGEIKIDPEADILIDLQKDLLIIKHLTVGDIIKIDLTKEVSNIEKTIADYGRLVKNYDKEIIFGGSISASNVYLLYTLTRKMERLVTSYKSDSLMKILPYFNRLSTLLLLMAKHINQALEEEEIVVRIKD